MNWPGENLVLKLWETLAEKGVGSLLKPWQMRREGAAQVDVRRLEMIAMAEAEREVEEIRSGRRKLQNAKYALSLTTGQSADTQTEASHAEEPPVLQIAANSAVADALRKEVNVAKAVTHAEDELKEDTGAASEKNIDSDWLYRWRDYAGDVSADELQAIWGRILAGESKSPGSYSFRLLDFVRNLTKEEALLIEKLSSFVVSGDILTRATQSVLDEEGFHFGKLLEMQELGFIGGVDSLGLNKTVNSVSKEKYVGFLTCHGKGLLVEHEDRTKTLKLEVYVLTTLGKQVMKLGKFQPNKKCILALGAELKNRGYTVHLTDYVTVVGGKVRILNQRELLPELFESEPTPTVDAPAKPSTGV